MGQQQLILLVLATVIVGLAIVVGIQAFTEGGQRANADAMMQDAVRIANDVQAWAQKPTPFGGPAADEDFTDATFAKLGYPAEGTGIEAEYENLNGTFDLTGGADILITGQSFADDGTTVLNEVQVRVCGTTSDQQIIGSVMEIGGQATGSDAPDCGDAPDPNEPE